MVILPTGTVAGGEPVFECEGLAWRGDLEWDALTCGGDMGECDLSDREWILICEIWRLKTENKELVEETQELEERAYQTWVDLNVARKCH